jgi:beta-N-acetylhexosaminidase
MSKIAPLIRMMLWPAGLLLLAVAVCIDDPYLAALREILWILALALAAAGLALAAGLRRRGAWADHALLGLFCAVPLALAGAKFATQLGAARVLAASDRDARLYGPHFIVGYWRVEEIENLVSRGLIGGIFVTRHNIARGADALRDEIAHLQELRRRAGLPPLIVATDQEGGRVSHLSPPLPGRPSLAELAGLPGAERASRARAEGAALGAELCDLGVTLDFAPVVDLRPSGDANPFDFNSFIAQRAISGDPAVVREIATGFVRGLADRGVMATLKHFPVLGRVAEDTHHFRAHLRATPEALAASDWRPFRETLQETPSALMVGHVVVDALDPDRPASQSKSVVDGLLRRQWGFEGLIVTDDLDMGSVFHHGICAGVVASLNAGVDLLLVSYDGRQYYPLMACVLAAHARNEIDSGAMARSGARLAGGGAPLAGVFPVTAPAGAAESGRCRASQRADGRATGH